MIHDTRYAMTPDGVYIAYQVVGDGPIDIVWQFDHTGNVDLKWQDPVLSPLLNGLVEFARVILHDRRGTGLSSRNVALPNLETRVSDLRVVLDTIGADRVVLGGEVEGGAPNVLFAATDPDRIQSLVWLNPLPRVVWTPDFPWGVKPDYVEQDRRALELWGLNEYGPAWAATEATEGYAIEEEEIRTIGMFSRNTGTPDVGRELVRIWHETDVRGVLPSVRAPALLLVDRDFPDDIEMAEYVASLMPNAEIQIYTDDRKSLGRGIEAIRRFLGAVPAPIGLDTVLTTVLFTDIVGSTEHQVALGDRGWKEMLERHHAVVRQALRRWRGSEIDTAGDGFYATFDGPARAIRCALDVSERIRDVGIEIRAGIHIGECEVIDDKVGGLSVTIGARVAATAAPSEVRVSQTVKDLVAGSGFRFEEGGEYELKGVPDRWRIYAVASE